MDNKRKSKEITGNYQFGLPKNMQDKSNAEVEGGEYIKDNLGNVSEVEGPKHSKGGVKVLLENGDRILTDYTKIDDKLAAKIKDNLGIRVSKRDTYATVLDKFNKKIGLTELLEKETNLNKRILDQEDPRIEANTRTLNLQALSGRLEEVKEGKKSLEDKQNELFDILYQDQEKRKTFETVKEKYFTGGQFQRGGSFYNSVIPEWYQGDDVWQRQHSITGGPTYGENMLNRTDDMIGHIRDNMPGLFEQNFSQGITTDNTLNFQRNYNSGLDAQLADVARLYGEDSDNYRQFQNEVNKYKFTNDGSVNSMDGKLGNRTSSRAAFSLNLVPEDVKKRLDEAGIRTVGQLRGSSDFKDIYDQYGTGLNDNWLIGQLQQAQAITGTPAGRMGMEGPTTANIVAPYTASTENNNPEVKDELNNKPKGPNPLESLLTLFPDSGIKKPEGVLPHLKTQNYLEQMDTPKATAEAGQRELNRSRMSTMQNLENLDPQSRALATLGVQSQVNDSIVKLHSNVGDTNAKIDQGNRQQNMQLRDLFQQRQNASAMDYEQKTYRAMANNEANWRNYFGDVARDQRQKWNATNKLNANNAMNPDVQFYNGRFNVRKLKINDRMLNSLMDSDEGRKLIEEAYKRQNKTKK